MCKKFTVWNTSFFIELRNICVFETNGHLELVWRLTREREFLINRDLFYIYIKLFCDTGVALPNPYLKIY